MTSPCWNWYCWWCRRRRRNSISCRYCRWCRRRYTRSWSCVYFNDCCSCCSCGRCPGSGCCYSGALVAQRGLGRGYGDWRFSLSSLIVPESNQASVVPEGHECNWPGFVAHARISFWWHSITALSLSVLLSLSDSLQCLSRSDAALVSVAYNTSVMLCYKHLAVKTRWQPASQRGSKWSWVLWTGIIRTMDPKQATLLSQLLRAAGAGGK